MTMEQNAMKPGNYARFYGLLKLMPGLDKDDLKEQLVNQWTKGRTSSLKEMTLAEYKAMCNYLGKRFDNAGEVELRFHRSVCLKLIQKMGIDTTDWNAVNNLCLNNRIAGKRFGSLSTEELSKLSVKLRMILKKDEEKGKKDNKPLNNEDYGDKKEPIGGPQPE